MNDPHVKELHYRLIHDEHVDYEEAPPLEHETDAFYVRVADGRAVFLMKEHYAATAAARAVVDPYIRAWEIDAGLEYGPGVFALEFERAVVIDRAQPDSLEGAMYGAAVAVCGTDAILSKSMERFPTPPQSLKVSPEVEDMYYLYAESRRHRVERLVATNAYACLIRLEQMTGVSRGRRAAAAKQYAISLDILNKIGDLTANRGGLAGARKNVETAPFTQQETMWLLKVTQALILRVGEFNATGGNNLRHLTRADLPPLI
jgi:hypothetical protein